MVSNPVSTKEATVELGGKQYKLTAAVPVLRERESYIKSLMPDPATLLKSEGLPSDVIDAIIRKCLDPRVVTFAEDAVFENSVHGICYRLLLALRAHHGDEFKSVDNVFELVMRDGMDKLQSLNATLNEVDAPSSSLPSDEVEIEARAKSTAA